MSHNTKINSTLKKTDPNLLSLNKTVPRGRGLQGEKKSMSINEPVVDMVHDRKAKPVRTQTMG